jgi:hypothetical protein
MTAPKSVVRDSILHWTKSTKHKHVYGDTTDSGCPVPSVYIEKSALPTEPPKTILVSIEIVA